MLTVYFPLYLNFLCYIFFSQFETKFETQTRIKNPPDSLMSDDETEQPWCCCDVIQVHRQEVRRSASLQARSQMMWESHSQIAYKLSIALIELRPEESPRVRKQSRGSPVRHCILAGPLLTTIKNRSGTNFSFLSPLYLSYFLSTLLSSHLLLSFYLPCMYIIYIVFLLCCECVWMFDEWFTNEGIFFHS